MVLLFRGVVAPNVEFPVGVPDGGGLADDASQLLDPIDPTNRWMSVRPA
jgi:hypothetical protein